MKRIFYLLLLSVLCIVSKTDAQGCSFSFATTGTTAQMDSAINFTGNIWGQYLNSNVPIKVHVFYGNLFGATLAITIPNGRRDFPSAPVDSVWYASCLANSIAGTELNPGEEDMNIFFDNTHNWYFGTDGICPNNKYDFVSILLHEIGHGLGFLSLAKMNVDTGSFGEIVAADLAPLNTTFPFPDLQKKHSIFSHYMENASGQSLVDTVLFPNHTLILGGEFTSNAVYFNGPLAMAQNGGNPVRLFAPTIFEKGSSMEHLNENTFPASNPNTLMTPYSGLSEEHHTPGPLTMAILEDIGWSVNHDVGIENKLTDLRMEVFPNPVSGTAFLRVDKPLNHEKIEVIDMYGKVIYSNRITIDQNVYSPLDLSFLNNGIYTIVIKGGFFKVVKAS